MTAHTDVFEEETPTIRVVEGWIGNWRISLRRRGPSHDDDRAYSHCTNETGD